MRSVNNKTDELIRSTEASDYDLLLFTETWLKPETKHKEFMSDKYKSIRKDRKESDLNEDKGGGVLIAFKNSLECEELFVPEIIDLEAVAVKFSLSNCNLFLYCSYIQPTASLEVYSKNLSVIESLENQCNQQDIFIYCGDWNLPGVEWSVNDDGISFIPIIGDSECAKAIIAKHVTAHFLELGLFQLCNFVNKSGNVLDLVYTNSPELAIVEKADILLIPQSMSDPAHTQMVCFVECEPSISKLTTDTSHYCFRKANYDEIRDQLDSLNFHDILQSNDVNEMVDNLLCTL